MLCKQALKHIAIRQLYTQPCLLVHLPFENWMVILKFEICTWSMISHIISEWMILCYIPGFWNSSNSTYIDKRCVKIVYMVSGHSCQKSLKCLGYGNTHWFILNETNVSFAISAQTSLSIFVEAASVGTKWGKRPECYIATLLQSYRCYIATIIQMLQSAGQKTTWGSMERWGRSCCTTTTTKCYR